MLDPRIVATSVRRFLDADRLCVLGGDGAAATAPVCTLGRGTARGCALAALAPRRTPLAAHSTRL
jgi:hypothetical protein